MKIPVIDIKHWYKKAITPYLFLAPALAVLLLFVVLPMFASVGISFTTWDMFTPPQWVGTANYVRVVTDSMASRALTNTLHYVVAGTILNVIISLLVAMAVNQAWFKGKNFVRVAYFAPVVASMVAVAFVWKYMFTPQYGLINYILSWFGVPPQPWIYSPAQAMEAHIILSVWKFLGYNLVIFMAGLKGIPDIYYESAKIDGAGPLQVFFRITLPLLKPVMVFVVVTSVIGSFQVFDQVFVMSGGTGGPALSTFTVVMYLYKRAFDTLQMGVGCTVAVLMLLFLAGATALGTKFLRLEDD